MQIRRGHDQETGRVRRDRGDARGRDATANRAGREVQAAGRGVQEDHGREAYAGDVASNARGVAEQEDKGGHRDPELLAWLQASQRSFQEAGRRWRQKRQKEMKKLVDILRKYYFFCLNKQIEKKRMNSILLWSINSFFSRC